MSRRLLAALALSCALLAIGASSALAIPDGTLTVAKVGNGYVAGGGIDCGTTCTVTKQYGNCDTSVKPPVCEPQYVTVTAQAADGYAFDHWDGCESPSGRDCTSSATTDGPVVTAYFRDAAPPSVTLTAPGPFSTAITGSPTFTATATDNVGVDHVDFYVRGVKIASDSAAPYEATFDTTTVPDGAALIEARAVDAAGNVSAASGREVPIDNTAPELTITSGPDGQTFASGTTQTWTFTASDAASGIQSVTCSLDEGAWQDCAGSYSVTNVAPGSHSLSIAALDRAGHFVRLWRYWTIALAAPTATKAPAISGVAIAGQQLKATKGTWTGNPTSFAYKWVRCDAAGAKCAAIGTPDATDDLDYTLTSADTGHRVRLTVTASNAGGSKASTSAPTGVVGLPYATAAPVISGTAQVGSQLKTTRGTWLGGPVTVTFSWERCGGGIPGCYAIASPDATDDADYTPVAEDAGHFLRVKVTATNAVGSTTSTSELFGAITA